MKLQDKRLSFEVVPGATLEEDVRTLRELALVAGLLVGLEQRDGRTYVSVRYGEDFTEFIRSRNAGRPRGTPTLQLSCKDVYAAKETEGARIVAARLGLPLSTFYRRCKENRSKREEEPFL